MTDFVPADADEEVEKEPQLIQSPFRNQTYGGLDFDKLNLRAFLRLSERAWADHLVDILADQDELRHEIFMSLFRYVFFSNTDLSASHYEPAVELGFARFMTRSKDSRIAQADETLALLAGVSWFAKQKLTIAKYANDHFRINQPEGYELLVAYYLAITFSSAVKLSDVFQFKSSHRPDWADKQGRLVTVNVSTGGKMQLAPVDFGTTKRVSSARLGYKSKKPDDTIEWLRNPRHIAFCFPDVNMGPDICCYFSIEDGPDIVVYTQVKWQDDPSRRLPAANYRDAARTIVKENFYQQRTNVS
jgi:hypothetical protein